ncbi:MAG TPA: FtsW/RodA/SpoVE family cell cycle protein [Pirellulales bacterium]|jgi:cell division protein FtsW (lipid II flippase)|nr:FtsW/RodA/SpoVE family cell cycle protein [Pirellulales bacterium]
MDAPQWCRRLPWSIVGLVVALMVIGWLGIARAEVLAGGDGRFLRRQIVWGIVALAAMFAATLPSYRLLARWSYVAFFASLVLLTAVYLFPPINGAQRWIRFGSIGLQPSEFAKLAFVLGLARYLMYRRSYRELPGLLVPLTIVLVPLLLVLKEPDLGTALVFLPVLFMMLFAAGARPRHLVLVMVAGVALMPVLWSQMSREQRSRITALAQQTHPGQRPSDDAYHLHQAKQLLSLGGWRGSLWAGDATDDRSAYFVPESHTDSIAAVLGERLGLWGLALVLALFVTLVWRGLVVAQETREPFGRLVAIGIATLLAVQMLINTGMMVGLLPITGLALPLVSYGGSSLLANALAVGLLLNVGLRPGYEVTNEPFRFAE